MHHHDEITHVLRWNETRWHFSESEQSQSHQPGIDDQHHYCRTNQPPHHASVGVTRALEDAIKTAEEPTERRIENLGEFVFRRAMFLQKQRTQRRAERERIEGRDDGRDRDSQRELLVEFSSDAADESRGHEHRAQHQRHRDDRPGHFCHRFQRGFARLESLRDETLDVFHDDDSIIHHDTDGEHEAEQREIIQRETKHLHHRERTDQRHGHGQQRNERRAPRLQEHDDHDDDEENRFNQRMQHRLDGRADELRRIVVHAVVHAGRESFLHLQHHAIDVIRRVQCVAAGKLKHAE